MLLILELNLSLFFDLGHLELQLLIEILHDLIEIIELVDLVLHRNHLHFELIFLFFEILHNHIELTLGLVAFLLKFFQLMHGM